MAKVKKARKKKSAEKTSLKKVGVFQVGQHAVQLFLDSGEWGGWFKMRGLDDLPQVVVGTASGEWQVVVSVLIHEVMEMALGDVRSRFIPNPDFASASDGYIFHCDHNDFSEACARAGGFIGECLPAVQKLYKSMVGKK